MAQAYPRNLPRLPAPAAPKTPPGRVVVPFPRDPYKAVGGMGGGMNRQYQDQVGRTGAQFQPPKRDFPSESPLGPVPQLPGQSGNPYMDGLAAALFGAGFMKWYYDEYIGPYVTGDGRMLMSHYKPGGTVNYSCSPNTGGGKTIVHCTNSDFAVGSHICHVQQFILENIATTLYTNIWNNYPFGASHRSDLLIHYHNSPAAPGNRIFAYVAPQWHPPRPWDPAYAPPAVVAPPGPAPGAPPLNAPPEVKEALGQRSGPRTRRTYRVRSARYPRRPDKKTKETKWQSSTKTMKMVLWAAEMATEFLDVVKALWASLPASLRKKFKDATWAEKTALIIQNYELIDPLTLSSELIENFVEDTLVGFGIFKTRAAANAYLESKGIDSRLHYRLTQALSQTDFGEALTGVSKDVTGAFDLLGEFTDFVGDQYDDLFDLAR